MAGAAIAIMNKSILSLLIVSAPCLGAAEFQKPTRMEAAGKPVRVESPGFAAPCWQDVDGDGHKDLLVGQFRKGKIMVYKGDASGNLAAGEWLEAAGEVAEIPGVW